MIDNRNKYRELEIQLYASMYKKGPLENEKRQSLLLERVREEMAADKRRERSSFWKFVIIQGRYVGWKIWLCQWLCLLLITIITVSLFGIHFLYIPRYTLRFLCTFSSFLLLSAAPFFYRSVRYKMHELEASSYMSAKYLLAAKLFWTTLGNVVMLTGMLLYITKSTTLEILRSSLCLILPILLVSSVCLFLLARINTIYFPAVCAGLCVCVFIACIWWCERQPYFYTQKEFPGMEIVFGVLLFVFCVYQLWYLLYRCHYTELQII